MKKKPVIIIGSILLVAVAVIVLMPRFRNEKDSLKQYDFEKVKRRDLSDSIDATGQIQALEKKDLYADFEGVVNQVNVAAGARVKQGDILLIITSAVLKEQWQEANAVLKQAEIGLSQAATQLATEVALNRVTKNNALQVENFTHQVGLYTEQVRQAKERVKSLKAKNDGYYMAGNEKLLIRAPFDGEVAWIKVRTGDKVNSQILLATVINPERLGVEAQVDQNDIALVAVGQSVTVVGKNTEQTHNHGIITEVSTIGQALGDIVNFPIRIQLDEKPEGLQPGMTADLSVSTVAHSDVLAVPAGAVIRENGRDQVKVRRGNQLVPVRVSLGIRRGKYWEIKSGLSVGDQVAIPKMTLLAKQPTAIGSGPRPGMSPFGR